MKINDFDKEIDAQNDADVEAFLQRRFGEEVQYVARWNLIESRT
jgi:hypothetical protein